MKQVILKSAWAAGYIGSRQYCGVNDGSGQLDLTDGAKILLASSPMPFAGTFSNLALYSRAPWVSSFRGSLFKNGATTAQTVVLPSGSDGPLLTGGAAVAIAERDDVSFEYLGPGLLPYPGLYFSYSMDWDGPGLVFGIAAGGGTRAINTGWIAGAFGNGYFEAYVGFDPSTFSNTYSICPIDCTVTRLALKAYNGAPGLGSFTAWLKVDGVLQDGTGGTVNTATSFGGADLGVLGEFECPIAVGQRVDVVVLRFGIEMPFTEAAVGVGIGVVPTTTGEFFFCGGSNDNWVNDAIGYKWTRSIQNAGLNDSLVISAATDWRLTGIYTRASQPSLGQGWVETVLKNEVATAATVTRVDDEVSAAIAGLAIDYPAGASAVIRRTPVGVPTPGAFFWALAASLIPEPEPEPEPEALCLTAPPKAACWGDDVMPSASAIAETPSTPRVGCFAAFDMDDLNVGLLESDVQP